MEPFETVEVKSGYYRSGEIGQVVKLNQPSVTLLFSDRYDHVYHDSCLQAPTKKWKVGDKVAIASTRVPGDYCSHGFSCFLGKVGKLIESTSDQWWLVSFDGSCPVYYYHENWFLTPPKEEVKVEPKHFSLGDKVKVIKAFYSGKIGKVTGMSYDGGAKKTTISVSFTEFTQPIDFDSSCLSCLVKESEISIGDIVRILPRKDVGLPRISLNDRYGVVNNVNFNSTLASVKVSGHVDTWIKFADLQLAELRVGSLVKWNGEISTIEKIHPNDKKLYAKFSHGGFASTQWWSVTNFSYVPPQNSPIPVAVGDVSETDVPSTPSITSQKNPKVGDQIRVLSKFGEYYMFAHGLAIIIFIAICLGLSSRLNREDKPKQEAAIIDQTQMHFEIAAVTESGHMPEVLPVMPKENVWIDGVEWFVVNAREPITFEELKTIGGEGTGNWQVLTLERVDKDREMPVILQRNTRSIIVKKGR